MLFDGSNGQLREGQFKNGKLILMNALFHHYKGFQGDNKGQDHRASGAYIVRPAEQTSPDTRVSRKNIEIILYSS